MGVRENPGVQGEKPPILVLDENRKPPLLILGIQEIKDAALLVLLDGRIVDP